MKYPATGHEVYVSLNLSNTMLTGIGKGTITREEVSVDYMKNCGITDGFTQERTAAREEYTPPFDLTGVL